MNEKDSNTTINTDTATDRATATATRPRICFHNPVQFGDLFFSSPFVRHICESNPSRTFYYFLHTGDYVFSGSPIPYYHQTTMKMRTIILQILHTQNVKRH